MFHIIQLRPITFPSICVPFLVCNPKCNLEHLDTMGLGHDETGSQYDWYTMGLGHNNTRTQWAMATITTGLGHNGIGTR